MKLWMVRIIIGKREIVILITQKCIDCLDLYQL